MEKLKVVIIGSGNVATHLGLALKSAGNEIAQVFSPTIEHSRVLADKLSANAVESLDKVCCDADVYLIAIKDDAIEGTVKALSRSRKQSLFVHTAGSVSIDVMKKSVPHCGVLYPMQTFSKGRKVDFSKVPCFVEASDAQSMTIVKELAGSISEKVVETTSEKRKKLHLAAVFACNLTNHCYRLAEKILEEEGIDFKLYLPLIEETASKVSEMSPQRAQTGPMVRYDKGVMQMQIDMLKDERTKDIYRLMAESIHEDSETVVK